MKKLMDIYVTEKNDLGKLSLEDGFAGKILVDNNNYFEGVVSENNFVSNMSFIFGNIDDYENVDFLKVVPDDKIAARRIIGGSDGISFQGNSFPNGNEDSEDSRGVVVFTMDGEKTRDVTVEEVSKLESLIDEIKGNLGLVGREIYSSAYTLEDAKQNVKR